MSNPYDGSPGRGGPYAPGGYQPGGWAQEAPQGGPPMFVGFRCPFCQTNHPPLVRRRVSTAGWVTLVVLVLTCLPLFWIGLLIKEDYRVCSTCGIPLG